MPLVRRTAPRKLGFLAGQVRIAPDLGAPLPDGPAAAFGAKDG